ncbi:MAG: CheR family methyltransferase [Spirochaetia bacterium]
MNNKDKKETEAQQENRSDQSEANKESKTKQSFPIVGIGASAGGLDALKKFFSAVSTHSGMAYIVVVHLSPEQPSMMDELLQRVTEVPVSSAEDGDIIQPNHIYTAPSNSILNLYQGRIQLFEKMHSDIHLPINHFFRSLAQDRGSFAAAVILSGTGTDGSLGAKDIKQYEGAIIVQNKGTAAYNGMPGSVIETGMTDIVLPPEKMPGWLSQYFSHRDTTDEKMYILSQDEHKKWLQKILAVLRSRMNHDFYAYKKKTLIRRITRRMNLHQIEDYQQYLRFIRENKEETEELFRELLIGVTQFFRDAESFEKLKKKAIPKIVENMGTEETVRAWIPGCSTGEEVYSLAIVLREALDTIDRRIHIQLFGTDIDDRAIEKAREGVYPSSIASDVSGDRLRSFFTKEGDFYRVRNDIRESIVFSVQDVLTDPPFSRLHLLCCRNLLIYLETDTQKNLIPLFHYTLKPQGILMLGSSESIGTYTSLFEQVDKKWKIYKKREVDPVTRGKIDFPTGTAISKTSADPTEQQIERKKPDLKALMKDAIISRFSPTVVLVNSGGSILYVQGKTGKYLETGTGPPSQNIIDMAREGLRLELSSALRRAFTSQEKVVRSGIRVRTDGEEQKINLQVCPLLEPEQIKGYFLVVFEDAQSPEETALTEGYTGSAEESPQEQRRIAELERELQNNRESHQTTTEELESANEELKTTNEELQTVNAELQSKVQELSDSQDDFSNLLDSTEIATLFVDNNMNIKRFSQETTSIFNIIRSDIGRPLKHVTFNLYYEKIIDDVHEVITHLKRIEREVKAYDETWYKIRAIPYRTSDNRIDGAVLTFVDITYQKHQQKRLQELNAHYEEAWQLIRSVFDKNTDPLSVIDEKGNVLVANTAFTDLIETEQKHIEEINVFSLYDGMLKETNFQSQLTEAVADAHSFETEPFTLTQKGHTDSGAHRHVIQGRVINPKKRGQQKILLHFKKLNEQGE